MHSILPFRQPGTYHAIYPSFQTVSHLPCILSFLSDSQAPTMHSILPFRRQAPTRNSILSFSQSVTYHAFHPSFQVVRYLPYNHTFNPFFQTVGYLPCILSFLSASHVTIMHSILSFRHSSTFNSFHLSFQVFRYLPWMPSFLSGSQNLIMHSILPFMYQMPTMHSILHYR